VVGAQAQIAAAIRAGAPRHTIIAAGARWSDDDDLVFQEPLRDPNIIYNFHFYERTSLPIRARPGASITGTGCVDCPTRRRPSRPSMWRRWCPVTPIACRLSAMDMSTGTRHGWKPK